MTWFDIRYSGQEYIEDITGANEKVLVGLGFHGYKTQAEAKAHPNKANVIQMAVAAPILAGVNPGLATGIPTPTGIAQGGGAAVVAGDQVGEAINWLRQGSIWVRAAEVAAGLMLLYVGLKASVTPGGANVAQQTARQTTERVLRKAVKVAVMK